MIFFIKQFSYFLPYILLLKLPIYSFLKDKITKKHLSDKQYSVKLLIIFNRFALIQFKSPDCFCYNIKTI